MIECFRRKRVVEEWSYYLIDDEIVRINVSDLLTSFTTCAFEKFLQNDRNLRKKILLEERWDCVDERLRQKCIENVENDCCCRVIIRKRYISWKSLLRCVELDLEDWDENKKKNINKIVSDFRFRDDVRFKRALIRDAEIRDADDINERIEIEMIWLKENVFIYKQRAFRFEMFHFENQRNQKFDRSFVNFRFFDSDCLDSNNLSTFRRFDDSFARSALRVRECEIFAWEHDDQICVWISWLMKRAARRRWIEWLFVDVVLLFASLLFVNLNVLTKS
jgi:hypothetical protein